MNSNLGYSPEILNLGQNQQFFCPLWPLKFDGWPSRTKRHLFYAASSFPSHWWIEIGVTVWKHAIWIKVHDFFVLCDLEIWGMTLKNNRAPLLSNIMRCASFHTHMWIQIGVRKWISGVLPSVTLTFELWPWSVARTSLLAIVIIPENFIMIRWQEHCDKGITDGWTDRQTEGRTEMFLEFLGRR